MANQEKGKIKKIIATQARHAKAQATTN